ncbi:MAG: anthranilate phosphoribosyltransferase [Geminicoccaceae bacterium]
MSSDLVRFKELIGIAASGRPLTFEEAGEAFAMMMAGDATPAQMAGFLMALRVRGESIDEITAGAQTLRERMTRITAPDGAIDTCGTGGDASGTFNISTAAALVVAGAGVPVAKHGNRGLSSRSGSSDVLGALGVDIEAPFAVIEHAMARGRHRLHDGAAAPSGFMRHVAGPGRAGHAHDLRPARPLVASPAGVRRQVVGVFALEWIEPLWLSAPGDSGPSGPGSSMATWARRASMTGTTHVAEWHLGEVRRFTVEPESLGLARVDLAALKGGDAATNAAAIRAMLGGEGRAPPGGDPARRRRGTRGRWQRRGICLQGSPAPPRRSTAGDHGRASTG